MYTKDLVRRVTIRLDDELATAVTENSSVVGVTPSEWVRMVLHAYVHMLSQVGASVDVDFSGGKVNVKTSTEKAVNHANKKNH